MFESVSLRKKQLHFNLEKIPFQITDTIEIKTPASHLRTVVSDHTTTAMLEFLAFVWGSPTVRVGAEDWDGTEIPPEGDTTLTRILREVLGGRRTFCQRQRKKT